MYSLEETFWQHPRSYGRISVNYAGSDDRTLVESARAGDERAFEEIVRRYQRQVAHAIYLTLGSRQDVEDLAQDVFVRAYRSLNRVTVEQSLFSWIYRIAVNVAIDELRRRKIRRILSLDVLKESSGRGPAVPDEDLPGDRLLAGERSEQIRSALQRLSSTSRTALVLREYEGLSYREIGEVLHITEQAVKSRIFRARDELRALLEGYFKEGP